MKKPKGPIVTVTSRKALGLINRPDVAAVTMQSQHSQELQHVLDSLPRDTSFFAQATNLYGGDNKKQIAHALERFREKNDPSWAALYNEIDRLGTLHRMATGANISEAYVTHITPNHDSAAQLIKRFHLDTRGVGIRLLATLKGRGTEYLTAPYGNRLLQKYVLENEQFDQADIRETSPGEIILMKGQACQSGPYMDPLLYHRAPTLRNEDGPRLMVLIESNPGKTNEHAKKWQTLRKIRHHSL